MYVWVVLFEAKKKNPGLKAFMFACLTSSHQAARRTPEPPPVSFGQRWDSAAVLESASC